MILLSANPLKSQLNSVMVEEQRISRKIIRQERIIQKWLKEASVLAEKAAPELSDLASMRRKSAALRIKGSESLRSGMAVLAKERQNSKGHIRFKSNNKETAPRLIDIKL
ncbi:hypothetical protein EXM22_03655 [Oceanispirochaeta crateris]|uniref:Uncharacterized protein n=1 Tax=Oceanispirochaeta crateris TaxID=2518645 RepID=A0A5C1QGC3_9SPIO|nr:hypothetical protein [Oceanispirochaeta crateris]QEN07125.1 hypothetical protein EXM22_03655 [Oceanispirochaeta crateris]